MLVVNKIPLCRHVYQKADAVRYEICGLNDLKWMIGANNFRITKVEKRNKLAAVRQEIVPIGNSERAF